jgi:choline dehydrogenase
MNSSYIATTVAANQQTLRSALRDEYDFIVCGSSSSGSLVARRLAENAAVSVVLLEAGGTDDVPEVMMANQWPMNLESERDWKFHAESIPHVNGRSVPLAMGRVPGGDRASM